VDELAGANQQFNVAGTRRMMATHRAALRGASGEWCLGIDRLQIGAKSGEKIAIFCGCYVRYKGTDHQAIRHHICIIDGWMDRCIASWRMI
jgi:hypothetical protein